MQRRYRKRRPDVTLVKRFRVNEQIRVPEVMVIDEEGQNLGLLPTAEALAKAEAAGLDLVEVSPKAVPPVTRIINFSQFRYEQEKKAKKQKALAKRTDIKGIRLSPRIKGQDLELRQNQALQFLEEGHRVKIEMMLRGREKAHANLAVDLVKDFINNLGDQVRVLDPIKRLGGRISIEVSKK